MGNSSSEPEEVPIDLSTLPKPYSRDDCMYFSVVPVDDSSDLKRVRLPDVVRHRRRYTSIFITGPCLGLILIQLAN